MKTAGVHTPFIGQTQARRRRSRIPALGGRSKWELLELYWQIALRSARRELDQRVFVDPEVAAALVCGWVV